MIQIRLKEVVTLHGINSPLQGISYVSGKLSHGDIAEGKDAVFLELMQLSFL